MMAVNCCCNYTSRGIGAQTDMKTLAFALSAANSVKAARLAMAGIQGSADALDNLFRMTGEFRRDIQPLGAGTAADLPHLHKTISV